jgi:hypothetical protein
MASNGKEHLTYRLLPQEDWPKLVEFFKGEKGFVPPRELGVASVAQDDMGNIVGAMVLQLVSYLGPFKIDSSHTGEVNYLRLKEGIDELFKSGKRSPLIIKGYIVMTDDPKIAKMAEFSGMEKCDCATLVQLFERDDTLRVGVK